MMSERTDPSLRLAPCSSLSMRWTWPLRSRMNCLRVRVRSRNACTSAGGTKLGRIRPCARRSASQVASFTSVLRPGTALTWAALARASSRSISSHSTAQTGFQYTPVASITTCVTPWLFSHADKRSRSAVVVANVSTWRTTRAPSAMRAQATTLSLWMSRPAQRGCRTSMVTSRVVQLWLGVRGVRRRQ